MSIKEYLTNGQDLARCDEQNKREATHETTNRAVITMSLDHSLKLEIPFQTAAQANIAKQVLLPDPILKPQDFQVDYTATDNVLVVGFQSIDDRVLRVGVSSVIDSIKTIIETIDELGPETKE